MSHPIQSLVYVLYIYVIFIILIECLLQCTINYSCMDKYSDYYEVIHKDQSTGDSAPPSKCIKSEGTTAGK